MKKSLNTVKVLVLAVTSTSGSLFAVTPAFPDPVGGKITVAAGVTNTVTEADELAGITEIAMPDKTSAVIFDIATEYTYAGTVTGAGTVFKDGVGKLFLSNTETVPCCATDGGTKVRAGELHLPGYASYKDPDWKNLDIAEGATVFMSGDANCRFYFQNLTGRGTLTNGWAKCQQLIQSWTGQSDFYGKLMGEFWYLQCEGGTFNLWGDENDFRFNLPWGSSKAGCIDIQKGTFGVHKFGRKNGGLSSIGANGEVRLQTTKTGSPRLKYLGKGETSDKQITIGFGTSPAPAPTNKYTIDGGDHGNLVWSGEIVCQRNFSDCKHLWLRFDGAEGTTNVVTGKIQVNRWDKSYPYIEKVGAGTWAFKLTDPTDAGDYNKGVHQVSEGTLQFTTLREKGTICSLGTSELLYPAFTGKESDSHEVPYAFVLGGGAADRPAVLECIGSATDMTPNAATERPLVLAGVGGTLKTSCLQDFSLAGVSSISTEPVTLTLDGVNTASVLTTVSNGASAVSIAKKGAGTWMLKGDQTFSGDLAVDEGTLVVENEDRNFSWYKYEMLGINQCNRNNPDDVTYADWVGCDRMDFEFALYDADGIRRNVGLKVDSVNQDNALLQPGYATVESKYVSTSGAYWERALVNASQLIGVLFDDNSSTKTGLLTTKDNKQALRNQVQNPFAITMHLENGVPPITSFDVLPRSGPLCPTTSDHYGRTIECKVYGSVNGLDWYELSHIVPDVACRYTSGWMSDGKGFSSDQKRKLSDGCGFAIASRPSECAGYVAVSQLKSVSSVCVSAGATLKAVGEVTLPNVIKIAAKDGVLVAGGTIDGFTVPSSGTIVLGARGAGDGLLTFANVTGAENLSKWQISVGGVVRAGYSVKYENGKLSIAKPGLMIIVQ